jgi:hypothetical protein
MKESQFIGTLMPSHPDFQPIIEQIREKYQLPEVDPEGNPTKESNGITGLFSYI